MKMVTPHELVERVRKMGNREKWGNRYIDGKRERERERERGIHRDKNTANITHTTLITEAYTYGLSSLEHTRTDSHHWSIHIRTLITGAYTYRLSSLEHTHTDSHHWSIYKNICTYTHPISSARTPLIPLWYNRISQFSPSSWYGLMVPNLMLFGCSVSLMMYSWLPSSAAAWEWERTKSNVMLYSVRCTPYSILYTLYSVLHTLYSILCTLYSILYTLYSVLYTPCPHASVEWDILDTYLGSPHTS